MPSPYAIAMAAFVGEAGEGLVDSVIGLIIINGFIDLRVFNPTSLLQNLLINARCVY
jgi:hypothetical protein